MSRVNPIYILRPGFGSVTDPQVQEIVWLYEQGYSPVQIAHKLGMFEPYWIQDGGFRIKRILMNAGVRLRTSAEAQAARKRLNKTLKAKEQV